MTTQEAVDRVRELLNESSSARAWTDTEIVAWLNGERHGQHQRLKTRLQSGRPEDASRYWAPLLSSAAVALSAGTTDYSLPADLDMMKVLIDDETGLPLEAFSLDLERTLRRGVALSPDAASSGYFALLGDRSIRVLVSPGNEGVPTEARNLTCYYWKELTALSVAAPSATVDLEDQFMEAPILRAAARGMLKHREDPSVLLQSALQAEGGVA